MEEKIYCGEGWKVSDGLMNITLDWDVLANHVTEGYQGKGVVKVSVGNLKPETIAARKAKNPKDSRTHSVWINNYKKPGNGKLTDDNF